MYSTYRLNSTKLILSLVMIFLPLFIFAQGASDTVVVPNDAVISPHVAVPEYQIEQLSGDDVFNDFVVGPGKFEAEIAIGDEKSTFITITNRMGSAKLFKLEIEDMVGSQDSNIPVVLLGEDHGPYSLKDLISIPSYQFVLNHNERVKVPVKIKIPADAQPGGYYGSVLISTVAVEADNNVTDTTAARSAIISRIGTLFFITTPGDKNYSGELKKFATIPEQKLFSNSTIKFGLLFANTGSVHINPYGEIRIKNIFNEEVDFIKLDPWFTLPDSVRAREVTWSRDFLFGRYTAEASINRGYSDIVDTMSYTFWVVNWMFLLKIFAVVFAVIFVLKLFLSRFEFRRKLD